MSTVSIPTKRAPIPVQAPEPTAGDYFTELQWEVYDALIDAVVPSIVVASGAGASPDTSKHLVILEEQCAAAYEDLIRTVRSAPTYGEFKEFLAARPLENQRFRKQIRRLMDSTSSLSRKKLAGALNLMT